MPALNPNKQQNLDINNFCIMLYSEPLSMHKERPGLHTCALWEIRPQLALVESFPLLLYIIICYWLHFNLAALASSNLLSISSSSFFMSLVSSSDKLTWSKWFFFWTNPRSPWILKLFTPEITTSLFYWNDSGFLSVTFPLGSEIYGMSTNTRQGNKTPIYRVDQSQG